MIQIHQNTVIRIHTGNIRNARLSLPSWNRLADFKSDASRGFVRHEGEEPVCYLPADSKVRYSEHMAAFLEDLEDPLGKVARTVICFGTRNSVQNLFLPVYCASADPQVLFRRDEPIGTSIYTAICAFRGADDRLQWGAYRLRFLQADRWRVEMLDVDPTLSESLVFAFTGQPILFDGEVIPGTALCGITYDLRHIYHLEILRSQGNERHRRIHAEMMDAMMNNLGEPAAKRSALVSSIASSESLQREDGYLHSSISVDPSGHLNLIMMHGSLEDLAVAHLKLGAREAVLLDNGGSVGAALWLKRAWQDRLDAGSHGAPEPSYVGNGSYFRPGGHAVVMMDISEDLQERPFISRPHADAPFLDRREPRSPIDEVLDPTGLDSIARLSDGWERMDSEQREAFNRELLERLLPKASFVPAPVLPEPSPGLVLAASVANAIDLSIEYEVTSAGGLVIKRATVAIGGIAVTTAKTLRGFGWQVQVIGFVEGSKDVAIRGILDSLMPSGSCDMSRLLEVESPVTRVNLFLAGLPEGSGEKYFGSRGFKLAESAYAELLASVQSMPIAPLTFLIVGGGRPNGSPEDFFPRLISTAQARGARVFFDFIKYLSHDDASAILKARPYAAKMNSEEFLRFGCPDLDFDPSQGNTSEPAEIMKAAQVFAMASRLKVFLLSLGPLGAVVATDSGETWFAQAPRISPVSTTGAGNSMMAAMIDSIASGRSIGDSLRIAVACATATCMKPGTGVASQEDLDRALQEFEVPLLKIDEV